MTTNGKCLKNNDTKSNPSKRKSSVAIRKNRFKFESLTSTINSMDIDHFQRKAGFIGLKPSINSTWFYEGLQVYRENNLTIPFARKFFPQLREIMGKRRFKSITHLLLVKDELVNLLLQNIKDDPTLASIDVFTHLLSLLIKDLGEEELLQRFSDIWTYLIDALSLSTQSEHIQVILSSLMFCLKMFINGLIPPSTYIPIFINGLNRIKQSAVRKVASHALSLYLRHHFQSEQCLPTLASNLQDDRKLSLVIIDSIINAIVHMDSFNSVLFQNVLLNLKGDLQVIFCVRLLISLKDQERLIAFWKGFFDHWNPSNVDSLIHLLALKKGYQVRLHVRILDFIVDDNDCIDNSVMLALFLRCCPVDQLLSCRQRVQSLLSSSKVNFDTFMFVLWNELEFNNVNKWNLLVADMGSAFLVDGFFISKHAAATPMVNRSTINLDNISDSYAKQVTKFLLLNTDEVKDWSMIHDNILLLDQGLANKEIVLLCLASEETSIVNKALNLLSKDNNNTMAKTLMEFNDIPATLDRYRERYTLLMNLLNAKFSDDYDVEILFWYLLGACQVKLSLLLPAVQNLMTHFSSKYAIQFSKIISKYFTYVSALQRDKEEYCLALLPEKVNVTLDYVKDEPLSKLKSIRERTLIYMQDVNIRFGEYFYESIAHGRLRYSFISPSSSSNVIKLLSACPIALAKVDLSQLFDLNASWNDEFKKTLHVNYTELVKAYTHSRNVQDDILLHLIAMGDQIIQELALRCWLKLHFGSNDGRLKFLEDSLLPLLDDKSYREQLLNLSTLSSHSQWSDLLLSILIRMIYGRLICRAKQQQMVIQRRKAFLTYMGINWQPHEIHQFISFIMPSTQIITDERIIVGYLSLLSGVIQYLRLTAEIVHSICHTLFTYSSHSEKRIRSLAMKRLLQLLSKYRGIYDGSAVCVAIQSMTERLHLFLQHDSSLFNILSILAQDGHCDINLNSRLIDCLKTPMIKSDVLIMLVRDILPNSIEGRNFMTSGLKKALANSLLVKLNQYKTSQEDLRRMFPPLLTLLMKVASQMDDVNALYMTLHPLLQLKRISPFNKLSILLVLSTIFTANVESNNSLDSIVDSMYTTICDHLMLSSHFWLVIDGIAKLLSSICLSKSDYCQVFAVFQDLFAMKPNIEEGPDYDRRLSILSLSNLNDKSKRIVTYGCLQYLLFDVKDLAMRNHCLNWLMQHVIEKDNIVKDLVWKYFPVGCKVAHENVRLDCMLLLGSLVLSPRTDNDDESIEALKSAFQSNLPVNIVDDNIFSDLGHLQVHHRYKAVRQLAILVPSEHNIITALLDWLLPWALALKNKNQEESIVDPALQQEAQKAYSALLLKASERVYRQKLSQIVNRLVKSSSSSKYKDPLMERGCLKLLPMIFSDKNKHIGLNPKLEYKLMSLLEKYQRECLINTSDSKVGKLLSKRIPLAVALCHYYYNNRVNIRNEEEEVSTLKSNSPIIKSAWALLINALKKLNLDQVRHAARQGMLDIISLILKENSQNVPLVQDLLQDIHNMLCSDRNNNYEQVGYYTLGALLSFIYKLDVKFGAFDSLFKFTLRYLGDDLFCGSVAWQRWQAEWTGKVLEAKRCQAFDVLATLPFYHDGRSLLQVVQHLKLSFQQGFDRSKDINIVKHLKQALQKTLKVLSHNVITTQQPHGTMFPVLVALSNPTYNDFYNPSSPNIVESSKVSPNKNSNIYDHIWQLFAVQTSLGLLKKKGEDDDDSNVKLDEKNENSDNDSLKTIILAHLQQTRHSNMLAGCLKFINFVIRKVHQWPFSREERRMVLLKAFEIIVNSTNTTSTVSDTTNANGDKYDTCRSEAFKHVALTLDSDDLELTDQQVKALLIHCRVNFETLQRQQMTFALLKRVLHRCVTINHFPIELYLLMDDLMLALVRHVNVATRLHCRQVFSIFFRECPLAIERRMQILSHLQVDSVNYHHSWGRTSSALSLASILDDSSKWFPVDKSDWLIQTYAQTAHLISLRLAFVEKAYIDTSVDKESVIDDDLEEFRSLDSLMKGLTKQLVRIDVDLLQRVIQAWINNDNEESRSVHIVAWYCMLLLLSSPSIRQGVVGSIKAWLQQQLLQKSTIKSANDGEGGLAEKLSQKCIQLYNKN